MKDQVIKSGSRKKNSSREPSTKTSSVWRPSNFEKLREKQDVNCKSELTLEHVSWEYLLIVASEGFPQHVTASQTGKSFVLQKKTNSYYGHEILLTYKDSI